MELVGRTCTAGRKQGVRQGAPLSPWLVNVYLDHFLDQPWHRAHPDAPLLRTADDVLVLSSSRDQAEGLYDVSRRLRSAGVPLKGQRDAAIRELERGDKATWLGFQVTATPTGRATELMERSWSKLEQAFATAHEKPLAARVADHIVDGWLAQAAPCHLAC
ncbi:MAG: reverse transcriptase domain-containing protein [Pirellulaceae bacterium]